MNCCGLEPSHASSFLCAYMYLDIKKKAIGLFWPSFCSGGRASLMSDFRREGSKMTLKNRTLEKTDIKGKGVKNDPKNRTSFMDGPLLKKHQSTFEF